MEKKNDEEQQINIELPEDIAEGIYSNLSVITHSPTEFVCDFVQIMPGAPKAKVRSRVIMTPENTKKFLNALQENVSRYEEHLGVINTEGPNLPPINFGTPPTEA